jgi:hypothetical protein
MPTKITISKLFVSPLLINNKILSIICGVIIDLCKTYAWGAIQAKESDGF